jgi:hypothetical protein
MQELHHLSHSLRAPTAFLNLIRFFLHFIPFLLLYPETADCHLCGVILMAGPWHLDMAQVVVRPEGPWERLVDFSVSIVQGSPLVLCAGSFSKCKRTLGVWQECCEVAAEVIIFHTNCPESPPHGSRVPCSWTSSIAVSAGGFCPGLCELHLPLLHLHNDPHPDS